MSEQTIVDPSAGAGGGTPPQGGGEPGAGAGGGAGQQPPSPPAWQPPEWLPEHMRADDPTEALQKVWRAYEGYQKAHKSAGPVPESPDGYAFELPKELAEKGVDLAADDAAVKLFREAAHAAGLGAEQFKRVLPAFLEKAAETGLLQPPIDVEAELKALGEEAGGQTPEEVAQAGKQRLAAAVDFVKQLRLRGALGEEEAEALMDLAVDAPGVRAIEKLMRMVQAGESAVPGAQPGFVPQPVSQSDVDALMRDARYDTRSAKYNPAFRAEADRKIAAFYARGG